MKDNKPLIFYLLKKHKGEYELTGRKILPEFL